LKQHTGHPLKEGEGSFRDGHRLQEMPMISAALPSFASVYGPVQSWRYGRSLGIDPIGPVSTCSFDCVYCQLGEIERQSHDRQIFIPTTQILQDLTTFQPWDVDVITLSGSGEPTLALNLGEILALTKSLTGRPVGVLTNGSLLHDPVVRAELAIADQVAVKLDAVTVEQLQRVNRPVAGIDLATQWQGLKTFSQSYSGQLAIQTMLLSPWSEADQQKYIGQIRDLAPHEVQLNTPTRPRPLTHQLDARGNHQAGDRPYATRQLKSVSVQTLQALGDRIQREIGITVKVAISE
jgi:wyosine [tRNA(Phe)-imidazoG37] synthetase (radical SAM superfamily)